MPRSTILMVYVLAIGAVVASAFVIAFPSDTIWLAVALVPTALLGAVFVSLCMPQEDARSKEPKRAPSVGRSRIPLSVPLPATTPDDPYNAATQPECPVWSGSLRLRSGAGTSGVRFIPLRLALAADRKRVSLLPSDAPQSRDRVAAVEVVEYDPTHDALFLRVALERHGRSRCDEFLTTLAFRDHTLVSQDDTEHATVELRQTWDDRPCAESQGPMVL